ncbi:MAG: SulP family inorganic anion transporter, partial [Flavobacteriales bacterium]|nr:SulP family inorganic anion transporter [Flavobacteriales bacterium]
MLKSASTYFRKGELTYDLTAGIAVFLVALPLCLGIALASGAPPYAGLLSGMIGGIVVGFLSGSSLAVSGPAAGLSTVVAAALVSMPDYHTFMLSVVVAGLFQLLLGLFRLGIFANYFPSSVIKGMLAAIGILLLSKQIPIALGYDSPDFWQSGFLHLFDSGGFVNQLTQLNQHFGRGAIIITIVSLAILLLWQHPAAKKLKIIPAPLVVVLIGIALNKSFT